MPGGGSRESRFRRLVVDTRPLAVPDFRRLFLGQGVSFIGVQVTVVTVSVQMFDITRSSLWVGAIGFAGLVPLVVAGLYGGAVSDAMDRRRLLVGASLASWVLTVLLLLQAALGVADPWVLVSLVALQAVAFGLSSPTRGAIVPRLLPASLVPAGNTLNFTASTLGMVVGPLVAGAVLARASYAWAYGLDAALFTAGLYAALRLPSLPPLGEATRPGVRSVVEGLAFIGTRPILLLSFVIDLLAMVLALPRALFPEVAEVEYGGGDAIGWLFASIALGSLVAGLASGWIGRVRRQGLGLIVSVVVWGLTVAAAGLAQPLWLMVLLLAVGGAADLVSAVYRQTILQTYAPDQMRGRMQGVFIVVVAGGPRLGDLRAGASAAAVGVTGAWVGGGLLCVLLVVGLAVAFPALARYRADEPAAAG